MHAYDSDFGSGLRRADNVESPVSCIAGANDDGPDGVPALAPRTTGAHYFDWHHTEADTLDKVDLQDFRKNAAMLAVVTYILADMDGRLAGQKGAARE